jgi:sensor c-di-GMP phosphodiesterase-like protein
MGVFKRILTRRNLVAIAVGVLLAGTPLVIFDFWIAGLIERQGQDEALTSAKRAMGLAETRVSQVVGALDSLAAAGVSSCHPDHVQAMRQAAFATMPVKEVALIASGGHTLCTHLGIPLGRRTVLSTEPVPGTDGYSLEILTLEDGERMVRLRRAVGADGHSLAALVPAMQLLPQVSNHGGPFDGFAQIATGAGAVVGELGKRPAVETALFSAKIKSDKYAFRVEILSPRARTKTDHAELKWLGVYITSSIILIMAAFRILTPRRTEGDPVADLERALEAGEFVPYYQPIVDIRSGQLRGAEVLVRWRKPDGSLVSPGSFIPLAESSGMIRPMTRDLMQRVCKEAGAAIGLRPALKVSFNFTAKLFSDETIVKEVRNIFAKSPIKLSQVVLELTERDPIENFTETRQVIAALQGLGVRIAIDDVGTGHSGLSYMLKLGVDIIKIDKMFVDAIGTDRNSTTIVETLVDLAHNMRMDVVAEGVENFEQVMHLRELGIRSAQGYVFAPPLPGSAFLQLIEAIDPLKTPAASEEAPKEVSKQVPKQAAKDTPKQAA